MATGRVPTTANSPLTAKGDLFGYSTTQARVPVGNDGETLVADSSTSTGLRYQGSMAAGRNFIINGGMDIWQRGTSIALTSANTYTADRFIASANTSGAATLSRQATGDTTNLPFVQYCARFQRNAGNTATGIHFFNQPIETINSIPLAGKTVTVSFYARAGANYSAASNALNVSLRSGTGTDQNYLAAWTGDVQVASTTATLTTTWQRFQFTGTIGATATELTLPFTYTPTGTAGANDYYEVTGIQLEVGSIATQFSRAGATIQGELAACQRYYWRENLDTFVGSATNGFSTTTTNFTLATRNPVAMRVGATSVDFSALRIVDTSNTAYSISNVTLLSVNTNKTLSTEVNATISGGTAGRWGYLQGNGTGYLGFSAEL